MSEMRAGDRIICKDLADARLATESLKIEGIEVEAFPEDGHIMLVVLDERNTALKRLKRAHEVLSEGSRHDQTAENLIKDIKVAIDALDPGNTRADYIRSMNTEEIAGLLMRVQCHDLSEVMRFCGNKPECDPNGEIPDENCMQCLINYLNQEVPDGEIF